MMYKPSPFSGLNIGIPTIFPIKGRGFVNQGSGLASKLHRPDLIFGILVDMQEIT